MRDALLSCLDRKRDMVIDLQRELTAIPDVRNVRTSLALKATKDAPLAALPRA